MAGRGTAAVPRERANVSGNVPLDPGTYRRMLNRWLASLRDPRRTRPTGASDAPPVAPYFRLPPDKP